MGLGVLGISRYGSEAGNFKVWALGYWESQGMGLRLGTSRYGAGNLRVWAMALSLLFKEYNLHGSLHISRTLVARVWVWSVLGVWSMSVVYFAGLSVWQCGGVST